MSGSSGAIDHLAWAAPDLEVASRAIADLLGVEPAEGGAHPAWGTRNRLLALGPTTYLEIIGPDPEGPTVEPELFGIAALEAPRLVAWAARSTDLEGVLEHAARAGIALGPILEGSRRRPDGTELRWRLTDPLVVAAEGIVPFFIDWGDTPHPARSAPSAGALLELSAEHPHPEAVARQLAWLGIEDVRVLPGRAPRLAARIRTGRGVVELA